ncbi:MAG: small conductance mechanosensitive channel [Bacteroidia bacterium]|jgi:small conductance mechanosensitive channel
MEEYIEKIKSVIVDFSPKVLAALAILVFGWITIQFVTSLIRKVMKKRKVDESLSKFLGSLIGWALKVLLIVTVASKLGLETTSFAAIIGAAGLAIGLALQGALGNFAGGALIILFKPFKIGDLIDAQGHIGVVKDIQIFTTTINSPTNKRIIIPNGALSNGTITNLTAEGTLRVDLTVGIGYDEDIKKAKDVLMAALTSNPKVLKDPAPTVDVSELADSSVNFAVRPWAAVEDYWAVYFGTLENCKNALDAAGIEIPYPHQVEIKK